MHLVLVGLSHHTAPIEVRERLNCSDARLPAALATAAAIPGIVEVAILSTCNRMEIYAVTDDATPETAAHRITRHLAAYHQIHEGTLTPHLFRAAEADASSHLFRVASGLDSLVLGEAQILGQVRGALRMAQSAETVGGILTHLFQQSIACGRRVQSETGLGRGAFSIGHAAVDLARSIFADLSGATVLVLGAGKMSELTIRHLIESGVRFVVVANRTFDRAQNMAQRLGGTAIPYDQFEEALVTADIVIASTAAPHPIVRREMLQPVMRRRRGKPLFLIDIAVPRDIEAEVGRLENVFLKNIDDLQEVVAEEAGNRAGESQRAEVIVVEEVDRFLAKYRTREAAPVITELRTKLEQIRQDDLAILRAKLGHLSEREWQAIETATRAMMNRVTREPILRLKRAASEPDVAHYDLIQATREIFQLEREMPIPYSPDDAPADETAVTAQSAPLAELALGPEVPR